MSIEVKIADVTDNIDFDKLVKMINEVYLASEASIWIDEHRRISTELLQEIFNNQELIIAKEANEVVGCIHLEQVNSELYKFKMVAVDFNHKRKGIGGMLVEFAEQQARKCGALKMQLELLVPEQIEHPDKVMLEKWYTSIGYHKEEVHSVDYCHSGMSKDLRVECKAVVYRKALIL